MGHVHELSRTIEEALWWRLGGGGRKERMGMWDLGG